MWSLGKVIQTPEVIRVYIGSFWDQPLIKDDFRELFHLEQNDLFEDIRTLPKNAALRKLNDFIKRSRSAIVILCFNFNYLDKLSHCFFSSKRNANVWKR